MKSNQLAKDIIKQFEGLRLTSYRCPAGLPTIGYGHVIKSYEQKQLARQITEKEADRLLEQDVAQAKSLLLRNCNVYLTAHQKAALISFIFNCGGAAFQASTLRQKLNRGEYRAAADELLKWINCKGVKLQGLVKRRVLERAVFLDEIQVHLSTSRVAIAASSDYNNNSINNIGIGNIKNIVTASIKGFFIKLKSAF